MADKRGKDMPVQQGKHCPCAAAAGTVKPRDAMQNTGGHQLVVWQGQEAVHKVEHASQEDDRPSGIKQCSFFFSMLSQKIISSI